MKKDVTFSEKDVIRLYCNHITLTEKKIVADFFEKGGDCSQYFENGEDDETVCELISEIIDTWLHVFNHIQDILRKIEETLENFRKMLEKVLPKKVAAFFNEKLQDISNILIVPAIEGLNNFDSLIKEAVNLINDLIC